MLADATCLRIDYACGCVSEVSKLSEALRSSELNSNFRKAKTNFPWTLNRCVLDSFAFHGPLAKVVGLKANERFRNRNNHIINRQVFRRDICLPHPELFCSSTSSAVMTNE
ncbi:hypothetical protein LXL04_034362 [Taraxacum kok-saghyz]